MNCWKCSTTSISSQEQSGLLETMRCYLEKELQGYKAMIVKPTRTEAEASWFGIWSNFFKWGKSNCPTRFHCISHLVCHVHPRHDVDMLLKHLQASGYQGKCRGRVRIRYAGPEQSMCVYTWMSPYMVFYRWSMQGMEWTVCRAHGHHGAQENMNTEQYGRAWWFCGSWATHGAAQRPPWRGGSPWGGTSAVGLLLVARPADQAHPSKSYSRPAARMMKCSQGHK